MARTTRCPKCGVVQMARGTQCKKCSAPLAAPVAARSTAQPPPPPPINPYAPPEASRGPGADVSQDGLWRDGKILVTSLEAPFPDRCVKCNDPAEGYRLLRKLRWHPPAWYALILLSVLIYAVAAMVVQKKADVRIGLCARHRKRRTLLIAFGLGLPLLGVAGCSAAIENPQSILAASLGVFIGIVLLIVGTNILTAAGIDERFARIRGASPEFLASLPPFHRG